MPSSAFPPRPPGTTSTGRGTEPPSEGASPSGKGLSRFVAALRLVATVADEASEVADRTEKVLYGMKKVMAERLAEQAELIKKFVEESLIGHLLVEYIAVLKALDSQKGLTDVRSRAILMEQRRVLENMLRKFGVERSGINLGTVGDVTDSVIADLIKTARMGG